MVLNIGSLSLIVSIISKTISKLSIIISIVSIIVGIISNIIHGSAPLKNKNSWACQPCIEKNTVSAMQYLFHVSCLEC